MAFPALASIVKEKIFADAKQTLGGQSLDLVRLRRCPAAVGLGAVRELTGRRIAVCGELFRLRCAAAIRPALPHAALQAGTVLLVHAPTSLQQLVPFASV